MGFISKSLDMKTLARKLHKKHPAQKTQVDGTDSPHNSIEDLDNYLYQQLFVPIVRYDSVPTAGLDFARISHEDLNLLAGVLDNCEVFSLFNLGDAFCVLPPATSPQSMFI